MNVAVLRVERAIPWIILLLRIGIGGVFFAAGLLKFGHAPYFAQQIAAFRILPRELVGPTAVVLPIFEMLLGVYLIIGLFTRYAGFIAFLLLFAFDAAIASAVLRGLHLDCGCFGAGDTTVTSWAEVGRDFLLVLGAVAIFAFPPGKFSLDARMRNTG
jgi:putative oxidoreductase